ncbi:MAG: ABC transporter substrate-binding protein [Paraclostridium sp.]|uniref:ABC transporter substrate-binding protein n=1 Tax=Paraclostridium sp. TaxID=2023273 RepID=UPI003F2F1A4F
MHLKRKASALVSVFVVGCLFNVGCTSTGSSKGNVEGNSDEVMANLSARKAIAMAVDKDNFVDVILNNGSTTANYFVPKRLAIDENQKDYRDYVGDVAYIHDDEKAKEEWEKAKEEIGFDKVTLEMVLSDSESNRKLGEYVQSELSILDGLSVEIKQMPYKQVTEAHAKGEFDVSFNGWGPDYPDPLTYLGTLSTGQIYGVATGYESKEYNDILNKAKNSPTTKEAWELFAKAEKLLLDDAYVSPMYQRGVSYLQKDYVKDIAVATFGPKYSYKWADVEKDEKVLNIVNSSDITSLDAAKIRDTLSREVTLNVMEGLVRMDKDLNVVPGVAKEWEKSEDGKTWTFKLRDDAYWNNGEKVTAHDFEYSFKRTLTPSTACENTSVFYDIVGAEDYNMGKNDDINSIGVKALDDNTLEIKLIRPVIYFDKLMCHPIFSPQNQKFVEEKGSEFGTSIENTLFNGPFTLSTWKLEDQYSMEKNKNYWDKEVVKLDKVHTKIVKDNNTLLNLYETGNIDRVALTSENVDKYKDSDEFGVEMDCITYFLMLNGGNHK